MRCVIQETNNGCGAGCIAIIADMTFDEAVKVVRTSGLTSTATLVRSLHQLGIECSNKLKRFSKIEQLPKLCIVKLNYKGTNKCHWTVFVNGLFLDPWFGTVLPEQYPDDVRWMSYLCIQPGSGVDWFL